MRYQTIFAWGSLAGFVLGMGIALTGCIGVRLGLWPYLIGQEFLLPGVGIGAIALICGLIWLGRALWHNDSRGGRVGAIGVFGALLLVGIPAQAWWLVESRPPIHDISTDIGNPPRFLVLIGWRHDARTSADYDGPRPVEVDGETIPVALAQKYAYPDVKPFVALTDQIPQTELINKYFWRALNAVNALGWQVAGFDLKARRIEAVSHSFWFGTATDIAIRVRPAGAIGVIVDIRAKSRLPGGDGGNGARLIRGFIAKIKNG